MKEVYIIMHETAVESWLRDIGSLGTLAGLIYVNHQYGAGSAWIDGLGAILLFGFLVVRAAVVKGRHLRFTREELRRWALQEPAP